MSDLFFTTMKRLRPALLEGDLEACERDIASKIQKLPLSPFHIAIDLSINNDPAAAAAHFDRFFVLELTRFRIGAAYTEMNDFSINANRWFCDFFAYTNDGGHVDYDWLSDWESERFDDYTITGLEALQQVYASEAFRSKEFRSAAYMSSLMVVVKFQRFMQRAASNMKLLRFPLYVTAHDFDFIASFDPRPESAREPVRRLTVEEQIDELIGKLGDGDSSVRFAPAAKLYGKGASAKKAVPMLIERLDDADLASRQAAAAALSEIDATSDAVVSAMRRSLQRDPMPEMRREIIRGLGRSPTKAAATALAKAIFEGDAILRRYAVISLKLIGAQATVAAPALQKLLQIETDQEIRLQAKVALKRMGL